MIWLAAKALGKGLRVKGAQGYPGVFEMTWADNGRATRISSDGASVRTPYSASLSPHIRACLCGQRNDIR